MRNGNQALAKKALQPDEQIERLTEENPFYAKVLCSGPYSQILLMNIRPGEEIAEDALDETDTLFFIVKGKAESIVNGRETRAGKHEAIFVTAGTLHKLKNIGRKDLKLFVICSPALYEHSTIYRTPEEAAIAKLKRFAYAWGQ